MPRLFRNTIPLAVLVPAALIAAACSDSTGGGGENGGSRGRTPESIPSAFEVGAVVAGESLAAMDVDTFHFQGTAGDELVGYVQALGDAPGLLEFEIRGLAWIQAGAGAPTLEKQATNRFVLPETRRYTVEITSYQGGYTGPYRFQFRRVDRRPETAPRALTSGDTVTDAIEHPGDIDEYRVAGVPGQRHIVFLQATTGSPNDSLFLEVAGHGGTGGVEYEIVSTGDDATLHGQSAGLFTVAGDSAVIQVRAVGETRHRGAYRLMLYTPDPRPEHGPEALSLGTERRGEAIELPGDYDEFTLDLDRPTLVNVFFSEDPPSAAPTVHADGPGLVVQAGRTLGEFLSGALGTPAGALGTSEWEAGRWRIRVYGLPTGERSGPYRIRPIPIDPAPEDVAPALAAGATVTERLAPLGDVDRFTFPVTAGKAYRVMVDPTGPTATGPNTQSGVTTQLLAPGYPFPTGAGHRWNTGPTPAGERFIARATGTAQVELRSETNGRFAADTGSYRIRLESFPTTPESRSAAISIGDSISGEALGARSDIDDFVLAGAPGAEFFVRFSHAAGTAHLFVLDGATLDSLAYTQSLGGPGGSTTRVRLGPSGRAVIRVLDGPCPWTECFAGVGLGPYSFVVVPVNRAPESVPAAISLGTVVDGEAIAQLGDVDEFRFAGTAGQKVEAFLRVANGFFFGLRLELVSPAGATLASVETMNTEDLLATGTGAVTLPVTGTYTVRLAGNATFIGTGAYSFLVRQAP